MDKFRNMLVMMTGLVLIMTSSGYVWAGGGMNAVQEVQDERGVVIQSKQDILTGILVEYRRDKMVLFSTCLAQFRGAVTEEQKVLIQAQCKTQLANLQANLRTQIKVLFATRYASVLANIRTRLATFLSDVSSWPQYKKDELKARVTAKLDVMEEEARLEASARILIFVAAVREILAEI